MSSLTVSFHRDRSCQLLILIHEYMILIEHIFYLEGIYRILIRLFSCYLLFGPPLHCTLIISNWRLNGSISVAFRWILKYKYLLCNCIEGIYWNVVWAKKIDLLQICVGMKILLVLSFASTGSDGEAVAPTPVLLPGKSHGRRSLVGCSPWGRKESDRIKWLRFHFSLSSFGEGNGNPLQCYCLENPRDSGAFWAAIYGVAQSWTRLKQLSSSSSTESEESNIACDSNKYSV